MASFEACRMKGNNMPLCELRNKCRAGHYRQIPGSTSSEEGKATSNASLSHFPSQPYIVAMLHNVA